MPIVIPRPETANVLELIEALKAWFPESVIRDTIIPYTVQEQKRLGSGRDWKAGDDGGFVTIRYFGLSRFSLEDHTGNTHEKGLAKRVPSRYSSGKATSRKRRERMATARGRRTAPEPEPASDGEPDFEIYLTKDLSATMTDYGTWFEDNVADLDKVDPARLLALGSTLYPYFQKSDFNVQRRQERRDARAADSTPEPTPEPTPARRGRGSKNTAKAGTPAPAGRRGRGGRQTAGSAAAY